jgi:hypothetical protein
MAILYGFFVKAGIHALIRATIGLPSASIAGEKN